MNDPFVFQETVTDSFPSLNMDQAAEINLLMHVENSKLYILKLNHYTEFVN